MTANPYAPALTIEDHGPVRVVRINRPDSRNAIDPDVHRGLAGVWRLLRADSGARVVVLTGVGASFSAGGDLEMIERMQHDRAERSALLEEAKHVFDELVSFPLPVVAAVNGPAVGLGCTLALLCDLVYLAESAYLSDPHVAVGLTAGDGGASFLPMTLSLVRAREFLFFGDRVPAAQAVEWGLANAAVPDADLLPTAMRVGERLAGLPAQALRSTKQAVNLHVARGAAAVLDFALAAEHQSFDTEDHQAIVAGLRKR